MEALDIIVAAVVCFWLLTAGGLVFLVRLLYARWVDVLMREQRSAHLEAAKGAPVPDIVSLPMATEGRRDNPFRPHHLRRIAIHGAGCVAYAVVFGVLMMGKAADSLEQFLVSIVRPDIVAYAALFATIPLAATFVVLLLRSFQRAASGVWVAALIVVALPLGAVHLPLSGTDVSKVLLRLAFGVVLAFLYLRINAWRAERSRWSWNARGLHAFWLAFGTYWFVTHVIQERWIAALALLLVPYVAYEVTLRVLFLSWPRISPRRLLYLRVFGRDAQTDRMYRNLAYDWSNVGPVRLIGAPDLSRRTMSPQLLAAFVAGSLRRMFRWTPAELEARATAADLRLRDGVYRTLEILCSGETWRPAMQRLAKDAHVVVMDLRGFQQRNQGCAWELGQLANIVPLSNVLLCIDGSTDRAALDEALREAWSSVTESSPNRIQPAPFQLLDVGKDLRLAARQAVRFVREV